MTLIDFIHKNDRLKNFVLTIMYKTAGFWPDKFFLELYFYLRNGQKINLDQPLTFTEKINWLKLNEYHPEYKYLVDKYEVKQIVNEKLGTDEFTIPTLGVWESYDSIDFSLLPSKFVLKTTNGGGNASVVIIKDKNNLNHKELKKKLRLVESKPRYLWSREYPYYEVKPRIIAEDLIEAPNNELSDYKIFCFDGRPQFLFVATERNKENEDVKFDFFDVDFNHLPIRNGHDCAVTTPSRPKNFEKMLEIAEILSKGIKHVRIDLYNVDGRIYFGEYTLFHFAGMVPIEPYEWDIKLGELLTLKQK